MRQFNSLLSPGDYEPLLRVMLENPQDDLLIEQYENRHYPYGPNFYPILLRTIERIRPTIESPEALDNLDVLKQKFEQLDNTALSIDLPVSIVEDKKLRHNLEDHGELMFKTGAWEKWEDEIQQIIDITPRSKHIPFFKWCIGQLELNLNRFKKRLPDDPDIDQNGKAYERCMLFFERKIENFALDNPNYIRFLDAKAKWLIKMRWLGSQKELAELFLELQQKGWIEKFEKETIQECFTESVSVPQYLKPVKDPKTKQPTFDNLYDGYVAQFRNMRENLKRHK